MNAYRDQQTSQRTARYGREDGVEQRPSNVEPHALANELSDDHRVHAGRQVGAAHPPLRTDQPQRDQAVTPSQRSIAGWMGGLIASLIVIGLVIAALVTRNWYLLGIAALVFIPFMLLLLAPVWLASATKISQDHAAAAQNEGARAQEDPMHAGTAVASAQPGAAIGSNEHGHDRGAMPPPPPR